MRMDPDISNEQLSAAISTGIVAALEPFRVRLEQLEEWMRNYRLDTTTTPFAEGTLRPTAPPAQLVEPPAQELSWTKGIKTATTSVLRANLPDGSALVVVMEGSRIVQIRHEIGRERNELYREVSK